GVGNFKTRPGDSSRSDAIASLDAHRETVRRNVEFLDHILAARLQQDPEWVATVAFYAAVHAIEAAFAVDPLFPFQSRDHYERRQRLKSDSQYDGVIKHYDVLDAMSQEARYSALLPTQTRRVTSARAANAVAYRLIPLLDEIEQITGEAFPRPAAPGGP